MRISDNQEIVLGPPGCGKTTHLLNRIDQDIEAGRELSKIALVSFTKKAVTEALDRAMTKFDLKKSDLPGFQTIHSMCFNRLGMSKNEVVGRTHLREFGDWLGYKFEGTWDESEGIPVGSEKGDLLLFLENFARVTHKPLREVWENAPREVEWHEMERFQEAYIDFKANHHVMDFTDMLQGFIDQCDPSRASDVYIDEAQDLSILQWRVLQHAFGPARRVTIAGDDDQSIYKWSGADTDTFLSLEGHQTVLGQSYRLPKKVHAFAQNIVSKIGHRFDKPFRSTDEEGELSFVPDFQNAEIDPGQKTLILVRNTYLMSRAIDYLQTQGIPYIGRHGYSSINKKHVEAIRAVEKLRAGQKITGAQAKLMYDNLRMGYFLDRGGKTKILQINDLAEFELSEFKTNFHLKNIAPWYEMLEGIEFATRRYYRSVLASGHKLSVQPNIQISTIHGVKGGEADHVVVMSDMAGKSYDEFTQQPDNERRVSYVAVTRARKRLTILHPFTGLYFPYMTEGKR